MSDISGTANPKKWPLYTLVCWAFVVIYILSVHFHGYIFKDETEYVSIAKSLVKGDDFSILKKPNIISPAWPFVLSNVCSIGSNSATTVTLCHVLSLALSILNLFLITAFFKRVKINGSQLSDFQIPIMQLFTFGNIYFLGSAGTILTENISITFLFLLLLNLESGLDKYKALLAGILFAALALTKYVVLPIIIIFPVYYIYSFRFSIKAFFYSAISIASACLLFIPFMMRMGYINAHHLSDFSYMKNLQGHEHIEGVSLYVYFFKQGLISLFQKFQELFTTLNKDVHLPHIELVYSILTIVFLIPIFAFLVKCIKTREIFQFHILFTIFYFGALMLLGTGFTRYWLLVFPIVIMMFIIGIESIGFLNKPFFSNLKINKLYAIGALVILAIIGLYGRFFVHDIWAFKSKAILISIITVCFFLLYFFTQNTKNSFANAVLLLLLTWGLGRSFSQYLVMNNPMKKDEINEMNKQQDIINVINNLSIDSSTVIVVPVYESWVQAYANRPVMPEYALSDIKYKSYYVFWKEAFESLPQKSKLLTIRPWNKEIIYNKNGMQILKLTDKTLLN